MHSGIYQASQGMAAQWESLSALSTNLSRHVQPGHRRQYTAFTSEPQPRIGSPRDGGQTAPPEGAQHPVRATAQQDFSQGPLMPSDDPLHVAISGEAFFTIRETDGSTSYTRNGQFRTGHDGRVVTQDGAEVLMEGGSPLQVPDKALCVIQADGSVSVGNQGAGRLGTAHFDDPVRALVEAAHGRFRLAEGARALPGLASGDQVQQRELEASNSNPVQEMVSLIQLMRAYEANQKILSAEDDVTGKLIHATSA